MQERAADPTEPFTAETFDLGPRPDWNPSLATAFLAVCALVPTLVLGWLLRPIHPLLGIVMGLAVTVVAATRPRLTLVVGEDGVSMGRRFVAWRDLATVSRGDYFGRGIASIVLELTSGERVELWLLVGMGERIRSAVLAAKLRFESSSHEAPLVGLERRGRDPVAWVRELRAIGTGASATHRTSAVPDETLWQAALDPGADPGVRAAAAVALGPILDAEGRSRLRIAAQATASPRLRVAIERVLCDADEVAVAEALASTAPMNAPAPARVRRPST